MEALDVQVRAGVEDLRCQHRVERRGGGDARVLRKKPEIEG